MRMKEYILIPLKSKDPTGVGSRKVILSYDPDVIEFNMDELTQIRYDNIFGEIVTASALLNRIGLIKAEVSDVKRKAELQSRIKSAELFEYYTTRLTIKQEYKTKEGVKYIPPTNTAVEQKILLDETYQILLRKEFEVKKEFDQVDAFYWAIQDKCKKLGNIKESIKPEDFTSMIIEGEVNGFYINIKK